MSQFGSFFVRDFQISRVRTNLDFIRPHDLAKLADVNRFEKFLVPSGAKIPFPTESDKSMTPVTPSGYDTSIL
jgi:hypothetical protein